jgi:hypothetical protein
MSARDDDVREVAREVLAELLPTLLDEALANPAPNGSGHRVEAPDAASDGDPVVAQVPAPPVAMVHRPSGWREPDPPERPALEVVEDAADVERVDLRSDADLESFVHTLARRLEDPLGKAAILSGKVRFRLAATSADASCAKPTVRVEAGAVTERNVKDAAKAGARLVLSPRAVLTPMARDSARSLGVEIQKEKRC